MAQNVTQRFPFSNKGVVQKIDINQLQDGQYSFLLNTVSEQEGALAPRYGYQAITVSDWDGAEPSVITSMLSVRSNAYSLPTLYAVSTSSDILRISFSARQAATAKALGQGGVSNARIGMAQYGTSQSDTSATVYFATGNKMLRDKGYTSARAWGINPPYWPAEFVPGKTEIKDMTSGVTWSGTNKVNTTVSSFSVVATGSSYYKITPVDMAGITPGTFVYINGTNVGFVDKTDSASFYGYFSTAPSNGQTVVVKQYAIQTNPTPIDIASITGSIATADLSLSGKPEDGYNSDDIIHFSFYTSTPSSIYDVRLRLFTNGSTVAYYEKSIIPSPAQGIQDSSSSATAQQRADSASDTYSKQVQTGVYSAPTQTDYDPLTGLPSSQAPYDNIASGLTPAILSPGIDGATSADGYWTEINISKKDFLQVGGAGSGENTWKNITDFEVIVRPTTTATAYNFTISSIYAYGNVGLNSNPASTLTPYDYVYTYKDPESGAESNPSAIVDSSKHLYLTKQGIDVVVRGTDKTSGRVGGSGEGITKVCIYRRGGAFTDGLYRRVGIIDNPGVTSGTPNTGIFRDVTDDLSIVSAPIAEFDNFAPVTSDLNREYTTTIISGGTTPGNVSLALTLPSGVSSLSDVLTPGSIITIGNNVPGATGNQEDCVVNVVTSAGGTWYVGVYTQYKHEDNEQVTWSSIANKSCDLVLSAFNRMWVAGDSNNPNVLYSSKTGRPESFPVINEATGNVHQVAVSSPGDPINGIAEFNGEIVCLCQNSIYTIRLDAGKIVGPFKTPANRGLSQKHSWGYVDNAI